MIELINSAESLLELSDNYDNLMIQREEIIKGIKFNKSYLKSLEEVDKKIYSAKEYVKILLSRINYLIEKERENV